ncbi:MAG: hypothetical protein ACFE85_15770 [Candidatus Hodarchaeota archaeon]
MNEVVFLSLFVLLFIRVVGLGISVDFYFRSHTLKFTIFTLGWLLWFFAGIFPFLSDITYNSLLKELFLVINGLLASIGALIIFLGIIYNFKYIQLKIVILLCIIIIIFTILLAILINSRTAIAFSFIIVEISILSLGFLHLIKGRSFIEFIGKSINWYYLTLIFVILLTVISIFQFLKGYPYGLYFSDDYTAVFLNYFTGIGVTILILIFFIHYEYNILKQRQLELKDIYSHDLGNILQAILSATEVMKLDKDQDLMQLIREKSEEAAQLITKIRQLE